jgi:diacylglycerol kinase (ATP)
VSICIIFNPAARGEKARKFQAYLEKTRADWALKPTTGTGSARRLAAEAVAAGFKTIVAAGGDGTLNEVLNGISDAPGGFESARLGVLPLGTMNVFARELGIPLDVMRIWPLLESDSELRLDLGCAEYHANAGFERRYFAQLAGAGWDARSVELVNWELKKKIGSGAYVMAGFQALGGIRPTVTITCGSEKQSGELILIGNGRFYGGNFPIFHKGDLQDGILDAVIFPTVNWQTLPGHLFDFVRGRFFKEGGSIYLQGREFFLESSQRASLQLEGELVGELPARIFVVPKALRVVAPN